MTIAENLNRLYDVKENIKTAIETKGVTVGDAPFVDYSNKILEIFGGQAMPIVTLTQNEYDLLSSIDDNTIYLIKD